MLTDTLPMNAASSHEMGPSRLPRAIVPLSFEKCGRLRYDERADRNRACPTHHCAATGMDHPIVDISPHDSVRRRTATWPGMAAEIVEATRHDRIESRFCAPVHLLAAHERGVRHDGGTFVEGLPKSTLRDFSRKLIFVPAGHEYRDWQEPRVLTRGAYFYFDPAALAVNHELGFPDMSFAPRLFFEDSGLWDTGLKLASLITGRLGPSALCRSTRGRTGA